MLDDIARQPETGLEAMWVENREMGKPLLKGFLSKI